MVIRKQLADKIKADETAIKAKRSQIRAAREKSKFAGVTIADQFSVGRLGIKPFRARRKAERKQGLSDIGLFNTDMIGLDQTLFDSKKALFDFDNAGVL